MSFASVPAIAPSISELAIVVPISLYVSSDALRSASNRSIDSFDAFTAISCRFLACSVRYASTCAPYFISIALSFFFSASSSSGVNFFFLIVPPAPVSVPTNFPASSAPREPMFSTASAALSAPAAMASSCAPTCVRLLMLSFAVDRNTSPHPPRFLPMLWSASPAALSPGMSFSIAPNPSKSLPKPFRIPPIIPLATTRIPENTDLTSAPA